MRDFKHEIKQLRTQERFNKIANIIAVTILLLIGFSMFGKLTESEKIHCKQTIINKQICK